MTLSVIDAAAEFPDRPALVSGDSIVTFAELGNRVREVISRLDALGLAHGGGDPVAFVGSSDRDTLELVYALIEVGVPAALLHPKLAPAERRTLLDLFPVSRRLEARVGSEHREVANSSVAQPRDDVALAILFTSGSTGRPKGVVLSRGAFLASARASEQNLGWLDGDRWLLGLPIAHVGGLSILTRCLIARRTVVVPDEVAAGRRLDGDAIARAIDAHRVTLVSLVPTQLEWLLAPSFAWRPPSHVRAVLLGGAPARPALLSRAADLGVPVLTTYGCTEACSQVTTQPYGSVNRGELGAGAPVSGAELRIASDGAIRLRGPTLFQGYFRGGPAPLDADGFFETDDVGRIDERGMLHVLGRRSECIITGGENVFPIEVEAVLERCPGVAGACVFGVPDDTWGEVLAVAIVPGATSDHAMIAEYCRAHLASFRRPRLVAFVDAFRTTEAGKLDRAATARRARERLVPLS